MTHVPVSKAEPNCKSVRVLVLREARKGKWITGLSASFTEPCLLCSTLPRYIRHFTAEAKSASTLNAFYFKNKEMNAVRWKSLWPLIIHMVPYFSVTYEMGNKKTRQLFWVCGNPHKDHIIPILPIHKQFWELPPQSQRCQSDPKFRSRACTAIFQPPRPPWTTSSRFSSWGFSHKVLVLRQCLQILRLTYLH